MGADRVDIFTVFSSALTTLALVVKGYAHMRWSWSTRAVGSPMALLCAGTLGCAAATRGISESASEGAVEGLADPATQERIGSLLGSEAVGAGVRSLSSSVAQGAVEGVASPELQRRLARQSTLWAERALQTAQPIIADTTRAAIGAALAEVAADEHLVGLRRLAEEVSGAATAAVMYRMARGIEQDVAPALSAAADGEMGRVLGGMLEDPILRKAILGISHDAAHHVVLGTNAALASLRAERPPDPEPPFSWIERADASARTVIVVLGSMLAALIAMLAALLAIQVRQGRRLRELTST